MDIHNINIFINFFLLFIKLTYDKITRGINVKQKESLPMPELKNNVDGQHIIIIAGNRLLFFLIFKPFESSMYKMYQKKPPKKDIALKKLKVSIKESPVI